MAQRIFAKIHVYCCKFGNWIKILHIANTVVITLRYPYLRYFNYKKTVIAADKLLTDLKDDRFKGYKKLKILEFF